MSGARESPPRLARVPTLRCSRNPFDGHGAIVCCRDADGVPVRRPWAADYPSVRVTDTEESCPACGATDWDEYTPSEEWRAGHGSKVDGTHVPNPVVSCRICGHEEPEPSFYAIGSEPDESEDEATRAARIARAVAEQRKVQWLSHALTLRATQFPIYCAEGWPARVGGSSSQDDQVTRIVIRHYERPDADPDTGDRARLVVITKRDGSRSGDGLREARGALQDWARYESGGAQWPDASYAAITLWMRARDRECRAAVLGAVRSQQPITIDGALASALMLTGPDKHWVALARHADLLRPAMVMK